MDKNIIIVKLTLWLKFPHPSPYLLHPLYLACNHINRMDLINIMFKFFIFFIAKKLPKNEGPAQAAGQGRRLAETEQNRPTNNCCK